MKLLNKVLQKENNFNLITQNDILTTKKILNLYEINKTVIQSLKHKFVSFSVKSNYELMVLILLLDGIVGRLLLLSSEKYKKIADITHEVSLRGKILCVKQIAFHKTSTQQQTQWVIPTSGTTKEPKLVEHSLQSLTKTLKTDIKKGKKYVWGLCYDISRFAGLQVFLQALYGSSTLLVPKNSTNIEETLKFFIDKKCNILSATPSYMRKLLMSQESNKLQLKRITLGGEIVNDKLLKSLQKKYKNVKITHIYATTEIGFGFSVNDGKAGFPYDYIEHSVDNTQLKISKNTLWIHPKGISGKYLSNKFETDNEGFIDSGDLVKKINDRVYFLGRKSGTINVGGNKVQPEEVEKVILEVKSIEAAKVYAKENPIIGFLVCADIVTKNKNAKKEVIEHCKKSLESFKVPALIKIVDSIQITKSGKIKRS